MKIFILACNILVPLIMITIGVLYKRCLYKKINRILDLFIPIAMIVSGFRDDSNRYYSKNTNTIVSANKKCSLVWCISGISTLLITLIVLILNKSNIANAITFSDVNNVSVIMLELELTITVVVFITVEYILKKIFYKKSDE